MADDNLGNAGIAHLVVAVADDLEAVGVTNIGMLTEGNESSPDNPQLFAGLLNLTDSKSLVGEDELSDELTLGPSLHVSAMDTTASSVSTAPSTLTSLPSSKDLSDADSTISNQSGSPANPSDQLTLSDLLRVVSTMGDFTISLGTPIPDLTSLYKLLNWGVLVTCNPTARKTRTYHAVQARSYIEFDAAIRVSERPTNLVMPAGYNDFARIITDKPFPYRLRTHGVSEDWVSIEPKSATIMDLDRVLTVIRNDAVGRINKHESVTMSELDEGEDNAEEAPTMDPPGRIFA
jgi:hypothetical protein